MLMPSTGMRPILSARMPKGEATKAPRAKSQTFHLFDDLRFSELTRDCN